MEKTVPYPQETDAADSGKEKRGLVSGVLVAGVGIFSAIYLFNPGWGVIELIPDNIPFFGNLDEAAATAMLISALAYFGFDLGRIFGRPAPSKGNQSPGQSEAVEVESEVVEGD